MKGSLRARIEVPKGSFVKRELHGAGSVDFVSPLPCPFNYGYLCDVEGKDGDPADAVVLGPRLELGVVVEYPVVASVRFLDAGCDDTKWVLSPRALRRTERASLEAFFAFYARAKRALNKLRGKRGRTAFLGLDEDPGGPAN